MSDTTPTEQTCTDFFGKNPAAHIDGASSHGGGARRSHGQGFAGLRSTMTSPTPVPVSAALASAIRQLGPAHPIAPLAKHLEAVK